MADQIEILVGPTRYGPSPVELDAQGPYNGLTALHDAVWHGHREAVQALLRAKARTDLKTHAGLTARGLALLYGYAQIAELLEPTVPDS
jgi:ankyrin repeat protein